MSDWLDALPPPPPFVGDWLPGGWATLLGLAAAAVVVGALLVRRLFGTRRVNDGRTAAGGPRGELVGARPAAGAGYDTSGKPGGRDPSPPGLPPGQEARLRQVRAVADFLDNSLKIPGVGFPIGWDSVIGLVPGVGDVATGGLAAWIVWQGRQLGVPKRTLTRMLGNAGLDLAGGAVPGVGDVFDVLFKANRKNLRLIEEHLAKPPAGRRSLTR